MSSNVESQKEDDLSLHSNDEEIGHTTNKTAIFIQGQNISKKTRIRLDDIPKDLGDKLRHLDLRNDGYIDIGDILILDAKEQNDEKMVKIIIVFQMSTMYRLISSRFYIIAECFSSYLLFGFFK